MGLFDKYKTEHPSENTKKVVNIEWVLQQIDKIFQNKPPLYPPPIGFQYTQYPSAASNDYDIAFPPPPPSRPENLWPGTSWNKLWATEGIFFRTEGEQSSHLRTSGKQEDAIRNIVGSTDGGMIAMQPRKTYGAFSTSTMYNSGIGDDGSPDAYGIPLQFNANNNNNNSINPMAGHANGTDIRPVNRLFIIWERID
jgi:hypothetical protein